MSAGDDAISDKGEPEASAAGPERQPLFVVCSPRPRVGCTLVARLLIEYLANDGRRALAFDVNPDDRGLARHLPLQAIPATLHDTRGEMALFDRLILNDGAPKVVDLAADRYESFFDVMRQTGFAGEARSRAIDTIILFVTAGDRKSEEAYQRLYLRRGLFTVVLVENAFNDLPARADAPTAPDGVPPLSIGVLPKAIAAVMDRPDFSFLDVLAWPGKYPPMLAEWTKRTFLAFRDLELRLQMAAFANVFRAFAE